MSVEFNTNISLLMGGTFCGNHSWNKLSSSVDNCFKLYFISNGEPLIIGKNSTVELKAGNLYFINGYKLDSQKCLDPFIVHWVHFLPKSLYFNYVLKQSELVTELEVEEFGSFQTCFEKFKPYFSDEFPHTEQRFVQMEIQALVYFTITKIFRSIDPVILESDEQLKRIIPSLEFISENFTNDISLAQLADKCCMSPNYFHRIFTGVFNVSPLNYIRDLRMDEAIRQLAYTNTPVKTVAYNVGYDDDAYFSRVFSKLYKTSPGEYRKRFMKNVP